MKQTAPSTTTARRGMLLSKPEQKARFQEYLYKRPRASGALDAA